MSANLEFSHLRHGLLGHQGYPCSHDGTGFRLSSDQNETLTRGFIIRINYFAASAITPTKPGKGH